MSIDATRWAWQQQVTATQKLVLLSLADRADENHHCYPSTARISADTGLYRETIFEAINALESMGLIIVKRVLGRGNKFTLIGVSDRHLTSRQMPTCGQNKTSRQIPTGEDEQTSRQMPTPQSANADTHQSANADTESTNESINNQPIGERSKNDDFQTFWQAYPNQSGEAAAKRAWKKQKPPLADILAALTWQTKLPQWLKDHGAFIPLASNYLNDERWKDKPPKTAKRPEFDTAKPTPATVIPPERLDQHRANMHKAIGRKRLA